MYVCVCECTYVCMCECIYVRMCVCVYMHVCVSMYEYIFVYIYTHIYIYNYIQEVAGRKVNILGGHNIGNSKQQTVYVHMSYSEWFPR
jgi:vancomycin permeability regulator SanA